VDEECHRRSINRFSGEEKHEAHLKVGNTKHVFAPNPE